MGGAAGESAAFFLLPLLAIYFASGWRSATNWLAMVIAAMAVLPGVPAIGPSGSRGDDEEAVSADAARRHAPVVLCGRLHGLLDRRAKCPGVDSHLRDGRLHDGARTELNAAVVAGGVLATIAYSLLGRGIGVPAAGWLSDALLKRGIPRMALVFAWLMVIISSFQVLSMQVTTIWVVAVIACVLGTAVNSFPLITVLVNETYGPEKTASVFGFINTLGQIAGATVLAMSGYLGIALSTGERNALRSTTASGWPG